MKTAGIVAEFNPFHNGHKYLVGQVRENGVSHIAAVMGGSFLQRGNCAVLGKYDRARAAVLGGVDLVLELPEVYACASAERFAKGGIGVLESCGCIDTICCGAEYMNPSVYDRALELLNGASVGEFLSKGYSYPRAVQAAVEKYGDSELSALLRSPNDVLALEYLRAGEGKFSFLRVQRTAPHDSDKAEDGRFASASLIRKMMIGGDDGYRKYIPETTARIIDKAVGDGRCPARFGNNERGVLTALRRLTVGEIENLPDVSEGLENRIYKAIRSNDTLDGIIMDIKCKRYTYARISRILACAYLGIQKGEPAPQYIRVLAFNDRGAQILKKMKETAKLPVVMNAKTINSLGGAASEMIATDIRAQDLWGLCTPVIQPCGEDHYTGALKI